MKIEFRDAPTVKHPKTLPMVPRFRYFSESKHSADSRSLDSDSRTLSLFLKSSADFHFYRTISITYLAAASFIQPNPATFLTKPILIVILPKIRRRSQCFRKQEHLCLTISAVDPKVTVDRFLPRELPVTANRQRRSGDV